MLPVTSLNGQSPAIALNDEDVAAETSHQITSNITHVGPSSVNLSLTETVTPSFHPGQNISESTLSKLNSLFSMAKKGCINSYLLFAQEMSNNHIQTDEMLRRLDRIHLPIIIEAINKRYPGININHGKSWEMMAAINNMQENHRLRYLLDQHPAHYSFIEILKQTDKPLRIIGIDSAKAPSAGFTTLKLTEPYQAVDFQLRIQHSREDCTIFSLDFAVKSFLFEKELDSSVKYITDNYLNKENYYHTDYRPKTLVYSLPADFYIHTQARSTIKNTPLENKYVESINMTIPEWQERHLRPLEDPITRIGAPKYYNNSIEERRIELIKLAIPQ
ncbi:YopJ family acetyltransferase [Pantoea cypripedii]|uniref:YopJ family acetyltransferase n=1 Tax=Pantoea cypripedii TaxID=55209 RepID=UPI002FC5C620